MPVAMKPNGDRNLQTIQKVEEFVGGLKSKQDLLRQLRLGPSVLFLSCDKEIRENAKRLMENDGYTAFVVDDIKTMFEDLPEFEIEKHAIVLADIIVAVEPPFDYASESNGIERCPGLVQECTLIMANKDFQEKTIYIVPDTLPFSAIVNIKGLHYVYFPMIYRIEYRDNDHIVKCCTDLAKKEIQRASLMILNCDKVMTENETSRKG
ncbi:hypothetical protein HY409_04250 [Candidatus Gottesmanbacteria bacterium]|nr:hypothetical protein [Candidatus Gottesmanbacteria bacterium]